MTLQVTFSKFVFVHLVHRDRPDLCRNHARHLTRSIKAMPIEIRKARTKAQKIAVEIVPAAWQEYLAH